MCRSDDRDAERAFTLASGLVTTALYQRRIVARILQLN
jgi:hypothetical protein